MSNTEAELGTYKDFEIIFIDPCTGQPKDLDNVTMEVYHFEGPDIAQIKVPFKEPYIFTEGFDDSVNIASVCPEGIIDVHFNLELQLISSQLEGLGCPPNDFVVPHTHSKVAIVNGFTKYALSACEVAALINLEASGYTASEEDGFLVLTIDNNTPDCYLQVGNGKINCVLGLNEGDQYPYRPCEKVFDLNPDPMQRISQGHYIYCKLPLKSPQYTAGERYFVIFRGNCPISGAEEMYQEDFSIKKNRGSTLTFSFTK